MAEHDHQIVPRPDRMIAEITDQTESGLVLPQQHHPSQRATIKHRGAKVSDDLMIGTEVVLKPNTAVEVKIDDCRYLIFGEADVLAIVTYS